MSAIDYLDTVLDVDARTRFRLAIAQALAALRLDATASHTLRLHANSDCTYPHTVAGSATLTLRNESRLVRTGDAAIVYYGGDLRTSTCARRRPSTPQASLTISERCSTNLSLAIGGDRGESWRGCRARTSCLIPTPAPSTWPALTRRAT